MWDWRGELSIVLLRVLGICQINFKPASVDYMTSLGLIYFNVNVCVLACNRVCVCACVHVCVYACLFSHYLIPILEISFILSGVWRIVYLRLKKEPPLPSLLPSHPHTHKMKKRKEEYST